ncbi:DUF3168 domain-containing protein [Paracoccus cavernae]|uniref:DUF3168 domain-containing protein n=1 Tax=Paracoccus cavernae TaxID=1571207 RepID=UPI0036426E23
MRAGRAIRQAVIARLEAEVPALTGVYDRATESEVYPYVSLGPSFWNDESVECIEARSYTLQIDVWCTDGKGKPRMSWTMSRPRSTAGWIRTR